MCMASAIAKEMKGQIPNGHPEQLKVTLKGKASMAFQDEWPYRLLSEVAHTFGYQVDSYSAASRGKHLEVSLSVHW